MIKKILTALLLCLIGLSSYGDANGDAKPKYDFVKGDNQLSLNAQRTTRVLQKYFPNEIDREIVINTILGFMQERPTSKTSGWIDIDQIETLCTNGGYDLTKSEDQKKCINFVRAFVALTLDDYYEVCGKDAHVKGITAHCIDNVFYHENTIEETQVTMLEATGLAKEYVRINANKYNNDVIECSDKYRDVGVLIAPDYFIKCRSVTEPIYYEFKFDDVEEHKDFVADNSLEATICALHGEEYRYSSSTPPVYAGNGQKISDYKYVPAQCETADSSKCKLINVTANKFARKTTFKNGTCFIEERDSLDINNLRTAFGIDNKHFRNGIQMMSSANMEEKLCEYIMNTANTTITDCFCDSSKQRVFDFSGGITEPDDVYTCFANNEPIDFLFDDLNEGNKTLQQGGLEAFNCSRLGGEYQGKTCYVPDAELCKKIADATIADCPECAKAYFDTKMNACILPNSTAAVEHQKKINVALIIGGAVLAATIIIYTGGTGSAVAVIALETIGAGMELGGQLHIDGIADEFFIQANNCNNPECAESILREFFAYLSRMTNDLHDAELNGIDGQMARLIGLLPNDSQFLIDTVAGCYENNGDNFDISKCDDGKWNNDQIIRAVGIGLQFTSVVASVGEWALGATKIANKIPNSINALSKKIHGVQQMIEESISKGQDFSRSDIILRSHKYVQTVENSGPDGKRWVELWRKNASSNESLPQFQKQFGGDLAQAEARYGNINTTSKLSNSSSAVDDIKRGIYLDFDQKMAMVKRGEISEFYIVNKGNLSDDELKLLDESLQKEGLSLNKKNDNLFSVTKLDESSSMPINPIINLDEGRAEIIKRLNEVTNSEWWEYKSAAELGENQGIYRIYLAPKGGIMSEATAALKNKLTHHNIKFEIASESPTHAYLIIREENISDVGKIKPVSIIMQEAQKTGSDFIGNLKGWEVSNIEQVTDKYRSSVFKFTEKTSGNVYYLKHSPNIEEIERTKRAYEILNGESDIVRTVKVIEDDQSTLIDFAAKNNLLNSTGEYWVLLEEITASKTPRELLYAINNSLTETLRGKPITLAEQTEIEKAINRLNSAGINHGDLEHNMFFLRESSGKLRVEIIDFEYAPSLFVTKDDDWLRETFKLLKEKGLAE